MTATTLPFRPQRLVMICPSLTDQGGHEFDYTLELAAAAQEAGIEPVTLVPVSARLPKNALPGTLAALLPPPLGRALPRRAKIGQLLHHLPAYREALRRFNGAGTLWFVHSASYRDLLFLTLAWLLTSHPQQKLAIFLRQDVAWAGLVGKLALPLLRCAGNHGAYFVTDSDSLAKRLAAPVGHDVAVLPIPAPPPLTTNRAETTLGYFGARRQQKGFTRLPALLAAAQALDPQVRGVVQVYRHRDDPPDATLDAATIALEGLSRVRLIDAILASDAFNRELAACAIVLIPYDATIYRDATSGIFVQALTAGAVTVVPEGSWMQAQASKHCLSRVVVLPAATTPEACRAAMAEALAQAQKPDAPSPAEQAWRARQTGPGALRALIDAAAHAT